MTAYYNEIDPKAAAWLRELIKSGHIAPGEVDERSIVDIRPSELAGFVQCHFFAGIGVWSYALRRAGWPDNRPVWTGSCPCQPFSAAGKGGGFDDERHLWPFWFHLISECGPAKLFGEQVASKNADPWIDLVQTDMEGLGYAFGAVPFPSAGIGAPHIRDRTYWMADAQHTKRRPISLDREDGCDRPDLGREEAHRILGTRGEVRGLADPVRGRADDGPGQGLGEEAEANGIDWHLSRERLRLGFEGEPGWMGNADVTGRQGGVFDEDKPTSCLEPASASSRLADSDLQRQRPAGDKTRAGDFARVEQVGGLAHADGWNASAERQQRGGEQRLQPQDGGILYDGRPGPTNGFWRDADWLFCRDERWRPVEPGTFPLAYGAPARVGRLRGYSNAINAEAAIAFIQAATDHEIIDMRAA